MTINQTEAVRVLREALKDIRDYEGCMAAQNWPHVIDKAIAALAATSHIASDAAVEAEPPIVIDWKPCNEACDWEFNGAQDARCACAPAKESVARQRAELAAKAYPAIAPEASELPPSFATVKRLDGTDCPVYTAEQVRAAIAMHRAAAAKPQKATLGDVLASGGVHWDLFPGYLIDHCEGDMLSEEGLQFALAEMLKDPDYLRVAGERAAAEPVPTDPLDWPIPCDLVDDAVTLRKGVKLRTVLARLKFLSVLCRSNLPKAYRYDVEHPNDGLNASDTATKPAASEAPADPKGE